MPFMPNDMPDEDELNEAILQAARDRQEIERKFQPHILSDNEILINEIDMGFVQALITAVNESHLTPQMKESTRKKLDRMQYALTLTDKIRVTF